MRLGRLSSGLTIIGVWVLSVAISIPAGIAIETDDCYCQAGNSDFYFIWSLMMAFLIPLGLIMFSYFCIFFKLRQKMRKKKESVASVKHIEMVMLDEDLDQVPKLANLDQKSWKTVKNWVKQRSFFYTVLTSLLKNP